MKGKKVSVFLTQRQYEILQERESLTNINISNQIRQAIEDYFDKTSGRGM